MKTTKTYYYRTWHKDRCGCSVCTDWHWIDAASKAEIMRRKNRTRSQIDILTEDEMKAYHERHPGYGVDWKN